jgi:sulfide dehydrogenase [flavocytochrome c] flavoprotein subunit
MSMNRRQFMVAAAGAACLPLVGCSSKSEQQHVVVVGGGFGGSAVAKYLKKYQPSLSVTLIEPKTTHVTCPGSNWHLADLVSMEQITFTYEGLKKRGIRVIHDSVTAIDDQKHQVTLASGQTLVFNKLVVSPGIDFNWGAIEGVTQENADKIPHAWQAGPQTLLLKKQIENMKQGGTFVMIAPPNPYRCPPGPYERVGMVAQYFKKHNPKAKIIVLDPKDKFSKQALFAQAWQDLYDDMVEWTGLNDGGKVTKVDVSSMTVYAEAGEIQADVINAIPPQKAGALAFTAGLTDGTGFCPVNPTTFESTLKKDIYVIGDAAVAGAMPKSAHSAVSHAKMTAAAIVNALTGKDDFPTINANTCYSLVSDNYAISIVGVYSVQEGKIAEIKGAGGVSPAKADSDFRAMEAVYAKGWYSSITQDVWGS